MKKDKEYTRKSSKIWDEYYQSYENGDAGNLYPNEPLVRVLSTIKKGVNLKPDSYFLDSGKENTVRSGYTGRALEIGFGHVSNLMMLSDKGFVPSGVEVSDDAIIRGRERLIVSGYDEIELNKYSPPELFFDNECFDFICGLQCMYYNIQIEKVISEVFRCLKPGGHFVFSFFSNNHDYHKYINVIENRDYYNVIQWSDKHPSYRIRGSVLIQPKSKNDLSKMFSEASELRVFTEETDFHPLFNSWWYIYGRK